MDHVEDFIELTGHSLARVSDQVVEACHSALNKRLERSNYWVKNIKSAMHGKKFYRHILYLSCYNI